MGAVVFGVLNNCCLTLLKSRRGSTCSLLLTTNRQKLKQDRWMVQIIQCWSNYSNSARHHCFSTTEWCVFQETTDTHSDAVIDCISKCIDNIVPWVTEQTFLNRNHKVYVPDIMHLANLGRKSEELLTVLRDNTGTKWSLTIRAPTPVTCGLD